MTETTTTQMLEWLHGQIAFKPNRPDWNIIVAIIDRLEEQDAPPTSLNYVTTNAEFQDMLREVHGINFNKPMTPPLRQMRAQRITAEIMQIVGKHLRDNHEAAKRNVVRDIYRDLIDMFFKADVDIITEIDRVEAGLPRRNAYGLTHDEMRIRELKLKEAMLRPMPSMFVPKDSETTKWISEIEEEMSLAKEDCSESKIDMNSFGYGYDLGLHDGLRKALQIITGKSYV